MGKVLVIGASQGIGLETCRVADRRGLQIRAMSRRGTLPSGSSARCEALQGDALRGEDVQRALDGIDTVVVALGVPVSLDLLLKPVTLFSTATCLIIHEMERAGVNRLIAVTGFGAGDSSASISAFQRLPFNLFLERAYLDKSGQERLIEASTLDWLIVRPGVLLNGPASHRYQALEKPSEWKNGFVSRADVAEFIVSQLELPNLCRRKPVIIRYPIWP